MSEESCYNQKIIGVGKKYQVDVRARIQDQLVQLGTGSSRCITGPR